MKINFIGELNVNQLAKCLIEVADSDNLRIAREKELQNESKKKDKGN